jgi:NAD(P)-dependent dehydrogenase (short-subunit alcohol dehydrogenase family)
MVCPVALSFLTKSSVAVVIGASGGIGDALARRISAETSVGLVLASGCRRLPAGGAKIMGCRVDVTDEQSIAAAAREAAAQGEVRLVIVASGVLHDEDGMAPEKNWHALDAATLARVFAINSTGPALVAKHFLPLFPRSGRAIFAALSARVGSIEDNHLGGWYAYRASKAALNMILKTLSIELARRAPDALCIGLHPGTVETRLSQPFRANVPATKLFTPEMSAGYLLQVLAGLTEPDNGGVFAWDGARIPA